MKVDQYRVLKDTKYSFLVPAGMDLDDFEDPEAGYLVAIQPFTLENPDIDLEAVVAGAEFDKVAADLENNRFAIIFTIPRPTDEELTNDGIG